MGKTRQRLGVIRTPDQRLRVFISSTLGELSEERNAARDGIERLRLSPVMFELGDRPHPPRELYRAYLEQSHVFVGIYWERYGWVAPGEEISGLEDEYRLSSEQPRLIYIKEPAPEREARLDGLLKRVKSDDRTSYKRFAHADELADLVENDLAVLLAERFETTAGIDRGGSAPLSAPPVPLTETVGRGEDVAAVAAQLEEGTRLLTHAARGACPARLHRGRACRPARARPEARRARAPDERRGRAARLARVASRRRTSHAPPAREREQARPQVPRRQAGRRAQRERRRRDGRAMHEDGLARATIV